MAFHAGDRVSRGPTVLIVDQHEVSRAACTALLRTEGMRVIADVASGAQAVAAVTALSPDIAVVDVIPSDPESLATAHRLRALPDGPAVVITSSANRSDLSLSPDAVPFLPKADICASSLLLASSWLGDSRRSE